MKLETYMHQDEHEAWLKENRPAMWVNIGLKKHEREKRREKLNDERSRT